MAPPRYRTLAHGADLRVAVWGADAEQLLGHAVLAVAALALGAAPRARPTARVPIRPWPDDLASQLVRAANEAIFVLAGRGSLPVGVALEGRRAFLLLAPWPAARPLEREIKAATYHDLRPRRRAGRLAATITLDV